ncbi:MAG: ribosome biogenesis GTPase Der [Acholeplasmatales bacterium]|jgi:GTP-binding protein|nr:ribosome biogenesis GTPase Der [Acholeplasmatales bacterium]MCI9653417.1 ribosome biogenesis GTPase Der [Acholeplasmatales bacterium]
MLPKVAIVGRPNVGKSTLFNRIIGSRLSITDDQPGVTRDRIYAKASWLSKEFFLIDTGGIELGDAPFLTEIKAQAEIAMEEADVIIFLTDCRNGVTTDDTYIAKLLYQTNKPVILAVNKVDDQKFKENIYEFYALGFGDPIAVSSSHGIGTGNLLDQVISFFPTKKEEYKDKAIHFSLVGRPNVGKSSLTNCLLNDNRVIVSPIAGTTRDTIDTRFKAYNQEFVVIDTAGLKKRGKVYENVEKYSVIRSVDAIGRSDIVLLVLDASTGILEQDTHVGQYIEEMNRPCIIVVNKWDLVDKDSKTMQHFTEDVRKAFKYLDYAPIVFLSALDNKRVHTLFPAILQAYDAQQRRISTSVLNDVINDAVAMFPPSEFNGGKIKIYYSSQVGINPPTFAFFVNEPKYLHFSYHRYLENQIRKNFDFFGTPIKFEFRKRD